MDELTFLLILAGIAVVLLVAMFTYYKHHKKIHDEIQDFNHHSHAIDDVLLNEHSQKKTGANAYNKQDPVFSGDTLQDTELPDSFTASKQDHLDFDDINFGQVTNQQNAPLDNKSLDKENLDIESPDKRVLVDGVYINSKRVISNSNATRQPASVQVTNSTSTFKTSADSSHEAFKSNDDKRIADSQTEDMEHLEVKNETGIKEQEDVTTFASPEMRKSSKPVSRRQNIKVVYDSVPEGVSELIVSHTILSKENYFTGEKLFNVLRSAGMSFGEMNIFHYPGDDNPETFALFSIANIVEPGTFNMDEAKHFTTPGVSMFMRLPTRTDSNEAYDKFIEVAQRIAFDLGGELCDESRSQLTQQTISYKKEQIKELKFNLAKAKKLAGMN